jgi:hypothetical protein
MSEKIIKLADKFESLMKNELSFFAEGKNLYALAGKLRHRASKEKDDEMKNRLNDAGVIAEHLSRLLKDLAGR